jgi:hypothetical protein
MQETYSQTTWSGNGSKLMDMIAAMVGSLDERPLFQSLVTHSGRHHARFGVQRSQYVAMGEALMWSLESKFGASFTPELRDAWRALYATVQVEMLRAAAQTETVTWVCCDVQRPGVGSVLERSALQGGGMLKKYEETRFVTTAALKF